MLCADDLPEGGTPPEGGDTSLRKKKNPPERTKNRIPQYLGVTNFDTSGIQMKHEKKPQTLAAETVDPGPSAENWRDNWTDDRRVH